MEETIVSKIRIAAVTIGAVLAIATGVACGGGATPDPTPTTAAPTAKPTTQPTIKPTGRPTTPAPSSSTPPIITLEQRNAAQAGRDYLSTQGFSRKGLIRQLSSTVEGYTVKDATAAVDSLHVDWNAQAVRSAKEYLSTQAYSRAGLIQQLSSDAEGFTHAQAVYGAAHSGL